MRQGSPAAGRQRRSVSEPLTGTPHTVPEYVRVTVESPAGVAVPPRRNTHGAGPTANIEPSVVQFIMFPAAVPDPDPLMPVLPQVAR